MYLAAAALVLVAAEAAAQQPCRVGHAVGLTIALEPPEPGAHEQLQQRLAAELRAHDLDLCASNAGWGRLAHLRVAAQLPELSPALVRIQTSHGAATERSLELAALPLEARPSAIASATAELLSSLLQSPAASPQGGRTAAPSAPVPQNRASAEAAAAPPHPAWKLPRLQLGVGGGGALFEGGATTYRGELLARWQPLSRLSATLRAGGDLRPTQETTSSAAGTELRMVGNTRGWHAGLDARFELSKPAQGFGAAAAAGLALARLLITQEWPLDGPTRRGSTGRSWEVAANVGAEASFRAHGWGADLGLSLLVPLTPREQSTLTEVLSGQASAPGVGFGEQLGGQLDLRFWLPLDM